MNLSDIDEISEYRRQLTKTSDAIIMALIGSSQPLKRIMEMYDGAGDKDIFVHALAATLLLRHRQWQAGNSRLPRDQAKIQEIFSRYDFRDQLGHPLLNCVDFLQLVESYCKEKEMLWKAFFAGFMSSAEGWNGEWPFERRGTDENIASVKDTFEKWIVNPASVPEPNWGNK